MTEQLPEAEDLLQARQQTQGVYDRRAQDWHDVRPDMLYEQSWLDRFEKRIGGKGHLLDLGCGSGKPLAGYFLKKGYQFTGIDYAPGMIEIARKNHPEATWHVADMTALELEGTFDGIFSWDGFFHLTHDEQIKLLPTLCRMLNKGGALMLTVGYGHGEVIGTVAGEQVYHASLAPEEYEHILGENGCAEFDYKANDATCMGHSVLLATKL